MTVRSLIERLQVVCRTPQNTEKISGVPTKNTPLSLEESTLGTPRTPRTPKKVEGQSENQKSPPDWAPPPPARLLAMAMALCDRTGASTKERQDWCADIEQAAPEHRGYLLALVQGLMPKPPAVATPAPPDPAKPLPRFHVAQPWNVADKAYQAHHWSCATCKAAARSGHSDRCTQGQHLYDLYEQTGPRWP